MQCTELHAIPAILLRIFLFPPTRLSYSVQYLTVFAHCQSINRLVEWVGPGAPVCEEHAETDSLEQAGQNTNGNSVKRSLLSDNTSNDLEDVSTQKTGDLMGRTYTWSSRGEEDQGTEVRSTLVAEGTGGIDESGDTIGLDTGSDE